MGDVVLRTATGVRANLIRMAARAVDSASPGGVYRSPGGVYRSPGALHADAVRGDGDGDGDGGSRDLGVLEGYPVVFDQWTEIHSWFEGDFLERIDGAALDVTLARRGDRVKVQFNHGMDPQIGDKPLGKPRVQRPDDTGMWAETPLSDTSYNRDLAALIRDGAIDGQSFRFSVVEETWRSYGEGDDRPDHNPDGLDERTITRLDLYEHGPVTFPAYEATTLGLRTAAEVAAWRSGGDGLRGELLHIKAVERGLPDPNLADVLQRDVNGSRGVDAGPDPQPVEGEGTVTSAAEDHADQSRTDDPRSPGRTTERHASREQRRHTAARLAGRAGAAIREIRPS